MSEVEELLNKAQDLITTAKDGGIDVSEHQKLLDLAKKLNELADEIKKEVS